MVLSKGTLCVWGREMMELGVVLIAASVVPVSAAEQSSLIESLFLATHQRPWLWGVYVFTVGLPIILFISFMWPDVRFGPPDQQYYYKKFDDIQPDDPQNHQEKQPMHNSGEDRPLARRRDTHGCQRDCH